MRKILPQNFFKQPVLKAAKKLLGKFLVRRFKTKEIALMITEVEAYGGFRDKASHASRGKTDRNKIMFEKGGCFYVYFTYGRHWMLNIVIGPKNYPAAVLIRGAAIVLNNQKIKLINGPARLTKFLKIDKKFNGRRVNKKIGLWLEDRGFKIKPSQIIAAKRVGVDYAKEWADKPYRFFITRGR